MFIHCSSVCRIDPTMVLARVLWAVWERFCAVALREWVDDETPPLCARSRVGHRQVLRIDTVTAVKHAANCKWKVRGLSGSPKVWVGVVDTGWGAVHKIWNV